MAHLRTPGGPAALATLAPVTTSPPPGALVPAVVRVLVGTGVLVVVLLAAGGLVWAASRARGLPRPGGTPPARATP